MSQGKFINKALFGASALAMMAGAALPGHALVVRDDVTVEGSEDADRGANTQWDGVVQLYYWSNGGGIFFNCTGSLVNHRTVLSAAHCFDNQPGFTYGLDRAGGQDTIIAAYGPDTIPTLFNWLDGNGTTLDARNGLTFSTQVIMHPDGGFGAIPFPGADVAMVALADPLADLPTYSMLFSPLNTGEHVSMAAYGGHGIGATGDVGIDGKRQAGENLIGMVGTFNDFFRGLEGDESATFFDPASAPEGNQIMYWIDFDNPERTGEECGRRDAASGAFGFAGLQCDDWTNGTFIDDTLYLGGPSIDIFTDDALPNEAGTAGGDSGSAIFFDQLDPGNLLIGGVLSGGWGFVTAPGSGYGDVSYYTPLFLYHQFIQEANPLKYVSTVGGDGNWSDAAHWQQDLDPSYFIIDADGNVVNGIPDGAELGMLGSVPKSGVIYDVDINDVDPDQQTEEGGEAQADPASAASIPGLSNISASDNKAGGLVGELGATDFVADGLVATSTAAVATTDVAEDLDTLLFGGVDFGVLDGAGSTGFVPNNGVNSAGYFNYFDVTLGSAGTTTADIDVVIDVLTLGNAGAVLNIADGVTFTSLVDTQIGQGQLEVAGTFASRDILNMDRVLGAGGTIITDTFFNAGNLNGGTGLTINGDLVLTSMSGVTWAGNAIDVDGDLSVGGVVTNAFTFGDTGTLFTYTGEQIGAFTDIAPGVLDTVFSYGDGVVTFEVIANDFSTQFNGSGDANTLAIANFLDAQRAGSYGALTDFYNSIDRLSGADLTNAIDAHVPRTALGMQKGTLAPLEAGRSQLSSRMNAIRMGNADGMTANLGTGMNAPSGSGMPMMALALSADPSSLEHKSDTGASGWGSFVELTYFQGEQSASLGAPSRDLDGFAITAGLDRDFGNNVRLGAFVNYDESDDEATNGSSIASTEGYMIGAYGVKTGKKADLSGYVGFGQTDISTARSSGLGSTLVGDTEASEIVAGASVSKRFSNGFEPIAQIDYIDYSIDGYTETGGVGAVNVADIDVSSLQAALGGNIYFGKPDANWQPRIGARLVYDFDAEDAAAVISLPGQVGTAGTTVVGAEGDDNWVVLTGGLDYHSDSGNVTAGLFAEQVAERSDVDYVTVGGRLRIKF